MSGTGPLRRTLHVALCLACVASASRAHAQVAVPWPPLPPGVEGAPHMSYYDVHGRTVAELVADLRLRGPNDSTGKFRSAFTESRITWRFVTRQEGATCRATAVGVTITAEVMMPRWAPPADTEPGLLAKWNQSLAGLAVHEAGHAAVVVRFASTIRDTLNALRAPCDRITADANDAGNRIAARMRAAQAEYDAETLNGLTQGSAFPPRRPPERPPERPPVRGTTGNSLIRP